MELRSHYRLRTNGISPGGPGPGLHHDTSSSTEHQPSKESEKEMNQIDEPTSSRKKYRMHFTQSL